MDFNDFQSKRPNFKYSVNEPNPELQFLRDVSL